METLDGICRRPILLDINCFRLQVEDEVTLKIIDSHCFDQMLCSFKDDKILKTLFGQNRQMRLCANVCAVGDFPLLPLR